MNYPFIPGVSIGLNNKVSQDSLPRNNSEGYAAMRQLVNVVHARNGELQTRPGSVSVLTDAAYIPLMPLPGNRFYAVRHFDDEKRSDIVVCSMIPGGASAMKIADCAKHGESWGWHPFEGCCWASSRSEQFVLCGDSAAPWPAYPLLDDDSNYDIVQMPNSQITERWGLCLVAAAGQNVWRSEPGRENLCRRTTAAIPIEDEVTMLAAVGLGLYVGCVKSVHFLQWQDIGDSLVPEYNYVKRRVSGYGALPGSRCMSSKWLLHGYDVGIETSVEGVVFQTTDGIVWGGPDGELVKIEDSLRYPSECVRAGATMWSNGILIHSRR